MQWFLRGTTINMLDALAAGLIAFAYVASFVLVARCARPDDSADNE